METVTIASSRGGGFSEIEVLVVSAIVVAAVAFVIVSRLKHFRTRNEHQA